MLANDHIQIAVCGKYLKYDAVHVGVYWNSENEKKILHFESGDDIPLEDATPEKFGAYFFVPITNFPTKLLPLMAATADHISNNLLNGFIFRRAGAYYDGGSFEYHTGSWTGKTGPEKFVNCAVFAYALLKTFNCDLLEWDTWPNADHNDRQFLDEWLIQNKVPVDERQSYYNKTKVLRGKHVLVSPLTNSQPSVFEENDPLASIFIFLQTFWRQN